eukprot:m.187396 g.187396  ORF g.187396 m.187396 type:complete len:484 (-) comp17059_c0_seq1:66-1517(-)
MDPCGCVVELDSAFRTARVLHRLQQHLNDSTAGAAYDRAAAGRREPERRVDTCQVLRPTAEALAVASRYHPDPRLRFVWVDVSGTTCTHEFHAERNEGCDKDTGGEAADVCEREGPWDKVTAWLHTLAQDTVLLRYVVSVYPVPINNKESILKRMHTLVESAPESDSDRPRDVGSGVDEMDIVATVASALNHRGPVRLQVRARPNDKQGALLRRLGSALAAAPHCVVFSPTQYTHTVTVVDDRQVGGTKKEASTVQGDGSLWYAICPRSVLEPVFDAKRRIEADSRSICRAEWKLREAMHDPFVVAALIQAARLDRGARALDLGAAPGGWTTVLTEHCDVVVAVDPAELDSEVAAHPRVRHLQVQAVDAIGSLKAEAEQESQGDCGTFHILVSDMNSGGWGQATADAVVQVGAAGLLCDGAALVLTVKGCEKASAVQLERQVDVITSTLVAGGFVEPRCGHMLANTAWERTVFAVWRRNASES